MRIKVLVLSLGLIHVAYHLQSQSSIEGFVLDSKTKEPLPGATVYLANTTHGTSATTDGSFLLNRIVPGKYDLIVSMVGYKLTSRSIIVDNQVIKDFKVYLEEEAKQLSTLEITAKRKNNRIQFGEFKKLFLGQTQNSYRCEIINIHDIFVYKEGPKLYALAHKPIIVENHALGYRIIYELKEFVIDYIKNSVTMAGIPRFENLVPKNEREEKRWLKERDRAYYGSAEHFFRSLKKKELSRNEFTIYDSKDNEIHEDGMFKNNVDSVMYYKGSLKIIFFGEPSEPWYDPRRGKQISDMYFSGDKVSIYDNGYYGGFHNVLLNGYIGWSCRIAEMIPLGYQPTWPLDK